MSPATFSALDAIDFPHAVVVTDAERVRAAHGPDSTIFPWASVTKLVTAMATLVAVERHLVDLDEAAGPEGATVRHLLAHASGVPFGGGDVIAKPGDRRIYSNYGFELLADHVAFAVGTDFPEWAEESVLVPLGMSTVVIDGSAAHAGSGSAADLAALGRELLVPTLVSPELHGEATRVVFPSLTGVLPGFGRQKENDWGLGLEVRGAKTPHWTGAENDPATFGHFGQSGSFLWVDPRAGLATAFLGASPFGDWAAQVWPRLSDDVLAAARDGAL
ncbi:serine hydrolase domain-containing protein [Georgenia sp. MJ206]|uniref:serine hydrolase domain-containing protein n=1 Tax=Georgenia wangjunii TaxID=3117730 RepID=UPI002F2616C4